MANDDKWLRLMWGACLGYCAAKLLSIAILPAPQPDLIDIVTHSLVVTLISFAGGYLGAITAVLFRGPQEWPPLDAPE